MPSARRVHFPLKLTPYFNVEVGGVHTISPGVEAQFSRVGQPSTRAHSGKSRTRAEMVLSPASRLWCAGAARRRPSPIPGAPMRGRLPSGLRRSKNVTLLSKGREWFEGRCDSIRALPYSKMAKDMGEPRGGPSNTILRLRTRRALKTRRQKVLPKRPFKREFTLVCESTYCALTHTCLLYTSPSPRDS